MFDNNIKPLCIKELLSEQRYVIPVYQRNYDWGEKEALQLLEDIADYASLHREKKYYIGSLIVFSRIKDGNEYYETIDGQQRLTTLTILLNVLKTFTEISGKTDWFKNSNLSYDHREDADEALRMLAVQKFSIQPSASSIVEVYRVIKKNLQNILDGKGISLSDFTDYLLSQVLIMRIPVPKDTQLNHYFEIMNSRGEQLEKHEVLKAALMDSLDECEHLLFNEIWEACSDMTSYVAMKFRSKVRTLLFSNSWADLQFTDFDTLALKFKHLDDAKEDSDSEEGGYVSRSISELFEDAGKNVKYTIPDSDNQDDVIGDRFGTIINFPNFLLHVLKIMYKDEDNYDENIDNVIKLDDKRLIDIFSAVLSSFRDPSARRAFVKRFIMALLNLRDIFDRFVIKRETYNGKETWSMKTLKRYDKSKIGYVGSFCDNDMEDDDDLSKDIRMLQAMFHVSAPTQIYKHWLNATLYYIYNDSDDYVYPDKFREYLYRLACTYMLDRYLGEERVDFEAIIYKNGGEAENSVIDWSMIDKGCDVENFIFNYYDYITWKASPRKYLKFDFTYRTSVEHFYPQTALEGNAQLSAEDGLDDFGNLCLISRGMNSKFSNNMPVAKYKNFGNEASIPELSIKLNEMFDVVREKGDWGIDEISDFEGKARQKLLEGIQKGCSTTIQELS